MTLAAELQTIRERHEFAEGVVINGVPLSAGNSAHEDRARLLHVLDEVLEVHRPTDMFEDKVCAECTESNEIFTAAPAPWPCFTVRTITRALEGK